MYPRHQLSSGESGESMAAIQFSPRPMPFLGEREPTPVTYNHF